MHYHIEMVSNCTAFVEQHRLEQVSDTQLASELSTWIKVNGTKLAQTINLLITDHANTALALSHFSATHMGESTTDYQQTRSTQM